MELIEALELLGLPVAEGEEITAETLTKKRDEVFIARSLAAQDETINKAAVGKFAGAATSALKREAKSLGIEFTKEEAELPLPELITLKSKRMGEALEKIKAESQSSADSRVMALEQEKSKAMGDVTSLKAMLAEKEELLEATKLEKETTVRQFKIGLQLDALKSKVKFSETATEMAKVGFATYLEGKYAFGLDEASGALTVTDKEGKAIQNAKKTGFASPEEVYLMEAELNGMIAKSNPSGKTGGTPPLRVPGSGTGSETQTSPIYQAKMAKRLQEQGN